jgi:tetratricopeptide (TPR) repeat protein
LFTRATNPNNIKTTQTMNNKRYYAFISYNHTDNKTQGQQWADWLHHAIETYDVPTELVGKTNHRGDIIPARIYPIFRDEAELPANGQLTKTIFEALDSTHQLIVICSPNAVNSKYVADEIDYFKRQGHSQHIVAAIIDGAANSVSNECFPDPLRFEYDGNGLPTKNLAAPLVADFRFFTDDDQPTQGWTSTPAYQQYLQKTTALDNHAIQQKTNRYQQHRHLMLLEIIASVLGLSPDELERWDKQYQLRLMQQKTKIQRRWFTAVTISAGLAIAISIFAYMQKELAVKAEQQVNKERNKAQMLLEETQKNLVFIDTDLRGVLHQYAPPAKQQDIQESINSLIETAKNYSGYVPAIPKQQTLPLESKVLNSVKEPDTNEHQQTFSLTNNKLHQPGYTEDALTAYQSAISFDETRTKQNPANNDSRRHLADSHIDLGNHYLRQGQAGNALSSYQAALLIRKNLAEQSPTIMGHQQDLGVVQGRVGDAYLQLGQTTPAITAYRASQIIAKQQLEQAPNNSSIKRNFSIPQRKLAGIYLQLGQINQALSFYSASITIDEQQLKQDPNNIKLMSNLAVTYRATANIYQQQPNQINNALAAYQAAMTLENELVKQAPHNYGFQQKLALSHKAVASLYLHLGQKNKALTLFETALTISTKLVRRAPHNTEFQRGLMSAYWDMCYIHEQLQHYPMALAYIEKARNQLIQMDKDNTIYPADKPWIAVADTLITELKQRI